MQIHFNLWPGDATFGGNFDPAILPLQQYIGWVQYSSFADGVFTLEWREDFTAGTLPAGWALGSWASPKNYSTHAPANVSFVGGFAVLSLTADDAIGFAGTPPADDASEPGPVAGVGGSSADPGVAGMTGAGGGTISGGTGGIPGTGGAGTTSGAGAPSASGGAGTLPTLTPAAPGVESDSGCSLGAGTPRGVGWAWPLVLGASIVLASRRRLRSTKRA
jgi:hypothetical protein